MSEIGDVPTPKRYTWWIIGILTVLLGISTGTALVKTFENAAYHKNNAEKLDKIEQDNGKIRDRVDSIFQILITKE